MVDADFDFVDYDDGEVHDFLYLNDDGSVTTRSYQDIEALLEANKIARNDGTGGWTPGRKLRAKANVPTNVILMWANKYGVSYGDLIAGRYPDIWKRELADRDNAAFRLDR